MKKIITFLLILIILFTLYGCGNDEDKIVMVTEAGFAPYEYSENNEIVGVDIDIAKEIASYLGKELVIKDVAFDSIINELNSDKADFAAAGMSITESRKKSVDFSTEYVTSKQVIVVRKDYDKINTLDDLNNKTVSVQLGSVADLWLEEQYPTVKIVTQKKFLTAAEDVKSSKSDCIIMDYLPAQEIVKNNPELVIDRKSTRLNSSHQ